MRLAHFCFPFLWTFEKLLPAVASRFHHCDEEVDCSMQRSPKTDEKDLPVGALQDGQATLQNHLSHPAAVRDLRIK